MSNIVNDKVENYIRETLKPSQGLLRDLEVYAEENSVPIIHKEVADLLRVLLKLKKPKKNPGIRMCNRLFFPVFLPMY